MGKYFHVNLDFDHCNIHRKIQEAISTKGKGYICVVDANVLTIAQNDLKYREVLNSSMVNTCDGSSIAMLVNIIYKKKFRELNGPAIFANYIEKDYKQLLLGSTEEISIKIKNILESKQLGSSNLHVMPLPFLSVQDFDYLSISQKINEFNPDVIWVSLGAPKQELFMSNLLPQLNRGVMFGIGAAFNFYIGDLGLPKVRIGALRFIWLNRLVNEPAKIYKRLFNYIIIIPKLYIDEKKIFKSNK